MMSTIMLPKQITHELWANDGHVLMSREYQGARDGKDEGKKREVNVGTSGWVEEAMVTKKNYFGQNHFPSLCFLGPP